MILDEARSMSSTVLVVAKSAIIEMVVEALGPKAE
jgi:hypothetical protein